MPSGREEFVLIMKVLNIVFLVAQCLFCCQTLATGLSGYQNVSVTLLNDIMLLGCSLASVSQNLIAKPSIQPLIPLQIITLNCISLIHGRRQHRSSEK